MALQTSGSISFSDIQIFGGSWPVSLSDYYKGGSRVGSGLSYNNYSAGLSGNYTADIPTSGAISLGADFYGAGAPLTWSQSSSIAKTGYGSNVSTTFSISARGLNLTSGEQFICSVGQVTGLTGWYYSDRAWANLAGTIGTSSSVGTSAKYEKQFYIGCSYDGNDTITITGYYSGSGTNYPNGQVFLQGFSRR